MDILKKNNWSKINEAYHIFINTGKILPNVVRPFIEESWLRSKNNAPWSTRTGLIGDKEYNSLLAENAELIKYAAPIMRYMYAANNHYYEDNFVQLIEKSGVILDVCTRTCDYPLPTKKRISEKEVGTCLTALVLVTGQPVELGGAEMFKVCYHTCYGGAAPIKDADGNLLGVISLYNNFGKIPEQPLEFVTAAAELISYMLNNKEKIEHTVLETNQYFTKMINSVNDYVILVDKAGIIVNYNIKCNQIFGEYEIRGKNCLEFGMELDQIIFGTPFANKDTFKIKFEGKEHNFLLHNNVTVKWFDNEHTLLLFNSIAPQQPHLKVLDIKKDIDTFEKIIGNCQNHNEVIHKARRAAKVPTNVLIDGESGTGKEIVARAIHNASDRANKPFIAINCGSIPKDILNSELFGYEEGAFTGGKKGGQIGKFEAANGGTILLDEIGEMPLEMQVSLLRFLQDKNVTRVGGQKPKKIDVRIMAATNRNLNKQIEEGFFREDLFYRLKVIHISLPPLRERKDDILLIADYYVDYYSSLYGLPKMTLDQDTKNLLYQYPWHGNVRELANIIENIVVFSDSDKITPDLLPREVLEYQPGLDSRNSEKLEDNEREIIKMALQKAKGNVSNAAKVIGISRNTLYRKIDKYGLQSLK